EVQPAVGVDRHLRGLGNLVRLEQAYLGQARAVADHEVGGDCVVNAVGVEEQNAPIHGRCPGVAVETSQLHAAASPLVKAAAATDVGGNDQTGPGTAWVRGQLCVTGQPQVSADRRRGRRGIGDDRVLYGQRAGARADSSAAAVASEDRGADRLV